MSIENTVAEDKMKELKAELKTVVIKEEIVVCKTKEYEEFLNAKTSLTNIEKQNYVDKFEHDIKNIK